MPQKTHIMHGRDHEPHGADPIRGLLPAPSPATTGRAVLGRTLDLRAYWRLGEAAAGRSPTSAATPPTTRRRRSTIERAAPMTRRASTGRSRSRYDDGRRVHPRRVKRSGYLDAPDTTRGTADIARRFNFRQRRPSPSTRSTA